MLYISEVIFLTSAIFVFAACSENKTLPVVVTVQEMSEISFTSAVIGGAVTDEGGAKITGRGICFSTSPGPTKNDKSESCQSVGFGPFKIEIHKLSSNTLYYARAWASNMEGVGYGDEISFTTKVSEPATLITTEIIAFDQTSATTGGKITNENGAPVTERGVCWDTISMPTVNLNTKTTDGSGTGNYLIIIDKLKPSTRYYVRAYATSSAGTGYGNEVSFITSPVKAPELKTNPITVITPISALSGGEITNEFGGVVTERGICWSTSPEPKISMSTKTSDGKGAGVYQSKITQLTPENTYFVRAYATNSAGTSYGNELSFTTLPLSKPSVATADLISTAQTAISGGTNLSDNGSQITACGVCWSITTGPTALLNTKTIENATSGSYISNITGLLPGTTYYLRAYATNHLGTGYGQEIVFTTPIADGEGNNYKIVKIGSQVWMAENLRTTRYNDKTVIPYIPGYSDWIATSSPAYCVYDNNGTNKNIYGALYNWHAIDPATNGGKNVCPVGWHIPSDLDWTTLLSNYSDELIAGSMLKESGLTHWVSPNTASNESGFTALPAGVRYAYSGTFDQIGTYTSFWSSTSSDAWSAYYREITSYYGTFIRKSRSKSDGCSVRCLRDQ